MQINNQLKISRKLKGLTQSQVADTINVDKTTYAHYESGRRTPNAKIWIQLCKYLEIPFFPAQIQIVYPKGMLDEFEKCIEKNGKTTKNFHQNNQQLMAISDFLNNVLKVHEDAMNLDDLPYEGLINLPEPITIMRVSLDIRAEKLIEEAFKCMKNLMDENYSLTQS